jgi:hypothetical protein
MKMHIDRARWALGRDPGVAGGCSIASAIATIITMQCRMWGLCVLSRGSDVDLDRHRWIGEKLALAIAEKGISQAALAR